MRYRLQHKETYAIPNILGNRSFPVYTYRWKDIIASDCKEALEQYIPKKEAEKYRIEDTQREVMNSE